jgi:hypothetical protein
MRISKSWRWVLGIAAAFLVYHLDAITGQWKFNGLCKTEAGGKYFAPVVGGVGWEAQSKDATRAFVSPLNLGAGFVRYTDAKGARSDVRLTPEPRARGAPEYAFSPVEESLPVRYRYEYVVEDIDGDRRFRRFTRRIVDLNNREVAASHTVIAFAWTTSSRVILNAPTGESCGAGEEAEIFFETITKQGFNR